MRRLTLEDLTRLQEKHRDIIYHISEITGLSKKQIKERIINGKLDRSVIPYSFLSELK